MDANHETSINLVDVGGRVPDLALAAHFIIERVYYLRMAPELLPEPIIGKKHRAPHRELVKFAF
jgi:hypothetical protein